MLDGKRNNDPLTIRSDTPLRRAAEIMNEARVGSLVVVDPDDSIVGIVTDRDLCLRAVAFDRDPDETKVASCMTEDVRTLPIDADLTDQVYAMRSIGARRIPLVDDTGVPQEISTIDDILLWTAARFSELAGTAAIGGRHGSLREPAGLLRELEAHVDAGGEELERRQAVPMDSLKESIKRLRAGLTGGQGTKAPWP